MDALFVTQKYIPMIIRIFLKAVSELYQKHTKINSNFYTKNNTDQSSPSPSRESSKIKSELHRLLVDIIASKWLVTAIFLNPDKSGLIVNRPVDKLQDLFMKFSKIFVYSLRGLSASKNAQEEHFMQLFGSFIEEQNNKGRKFIKSVLNISIGEIVPKGIRGDKIDEFNIVMHDRKYQENPLIDVFCISEGLVHKLFYSFSSQKTNIQNSKLENAIKTLGKYSKNP